MSNWSKFSECYSSTRGVFFREIEKGKSIGIIVLSSVLALQPTFWQKPDKPSRRTTSQPSDVKPTPLNPKELFKLLAPSVVVVETLDSQGAVIAFGSGVAVFQAQQSSIGWFSTASTAAVPGQRYIVTNKHVIEKGQAWKVRQGERVWPAVLSHTDPERDLCWLQVTGFKGPNVPLRASSTLSVGERVYAIGAPEGLELTLSEGLISGLREYDEGRLIQTTAAISPGSSGGGLFDVQGRLVGITTFYLKEGQSLNFALPAEWIETLTARSISAQEAIAKQSTSQALEWTALGDSAFDARDFEKAAKAYREVVILRPESYLGWLELGTSEYFLHHYDEAISSFKESIRLKPGDPLTWYNLGMAYMGLNEHEGSISLNELAIGALRESLRLNPEDDLNIKANTWNSLGLLYDQRKSYAEAATALKEAVRLDSDKISWYNLGMVYVHQGDRKSAMQAYEVLRTLDQALADRFLRDFSLP